MWTDAPTRAETCWALPGAVAAAAVANSNPAHVTATASFAARTVRKVVDVLRAGESEGGVARR
jgi:hypothetical protein